MEKSPSNASKPLACALRILTRRDHSEAELRQKLERHGFSAAEIDEAIARCYAYNYLDDVRYALERARALMRTGRGVGRKILLDLQQRGISEELAKRALAETSADIETGQVLRDLLKQRFPDFNYSRADLRERRRVIGFLQRRGFPLAEIFSILKLPQD